MSAPEGPPELGPEQLEEHDPLELAGNLIAAIGRLARWAVDSPLEAHIGQAGARQHANGELAAQLALVSAARDLRRIADYLRAAYWTGGLEGQGTRDGGS